MIGGIRETEVSRSATFLSLQCPHTYTRSMLTTRVGTLTCIRMHYVRVVSRAQLHRARGLCMPCRCARCYMCWVIYVQIWRVPPGRTHLRDGFPRHRSASQEMLEFCGRHNIVCDVEKIGADQVRRLS